jgi:adenine/guanine phosphoribosyltransferase-like PRPP-binding protein
VVYLVSNIVAQAVRRDDVLIVDDIVRDGEGRILGCRAFARV